MPIVTREDQTKGGRHVILCQVSGHVSGQDALQLLEQAKELAKKTGNKVNLLSDVAEGTDYSPESRRLFTKDFAPYTRRTTVIVRSKIQRATINFMMRMAARSTELQCFDDEASAIAWLDE
jgi:hypothetical protein